MSIGQMYYWRHSIHRRKRNICRLILQPSQSYEPDEVLLVLPQPVLLQRVPPPLGAMYKWRLLNCRVFFTPPPQVPSISPFDMHYWRMLSHHPHANPTAAGSPIVCLSLPPVSSKLPVWAWENQHHDLGLTMGIRTFFWFGQVDMSGGQMAIPISNIDLPWR